MKKYLYISLLLTMMAGCSSDSPEKENSNEEQVQETDITELLCGEFRFIDRKYEEKSTPSLGVYKTVPSQKEYLFSEDGKGELTTYLAENTPRGYSKDVTEFTWSATNKEPVTLNISLSDGEKITLENVKVEESELSYYSGSWSKELTVKNMWSSSYVGEYSADFSFYTSTESQPPYLQCVVFSPASLTVSTSEGKVTFITSAYGVNPSTISLPAYSKDGGPLTYYDCYIYACIDTQNAYYPYSFFDIVTETEEKPFSENGKMYFYLGEFDGEKEQLYLIESNKKYVPQN